MPLGKCDLTDRRKTYFGYLNEQKTNARMSGDDSECDLACFICKILIMSIPVLTFHDIYSKFALTLFFSVEC